MIGSDERGYTLIEMLMTMLMMGLVVGSLSSIFASGERAQFSLNQSFVAQQSARTALDKMRAEIHCANLVTAGTINTYPGLALTITNCNSTSPNVDYCILSSTQMTGRYALWRSPTNTATTCTSNDTKRVKVADYLMTAGSPASTSNIFSTTFTYQGLKTVSVDFKVSLDPNNKRNIFELKDSIVTRNSTRCTTASGC